MSPRRKGTFVVGPQYDLAALLDLGLYGAINERFTEITSTQWERVRFDVWEAWVEEARTGRPPVGPILHAEPAGAHIHDGVRCRVLDGFPMTPEQLATYVAEDRPTLEAAPAEPREMLERVCDFALEVPSGWDTKVLEATARERTRLTGRRVPAEHIWWDTLRQIALGTLRWENGDWEQIKT